LRERAASDCLALHRPRVVGRGQRQPVRLAAPSGAWAGTRPIAVSHTLPPADPVVSALGTGRLRCRLSRASLPRRLHRLLAGKLASFPNLFRCCALRVYFAQSEERRLKSLSLDAPSRYACTLHNRNSLGSSGSCVPDRGVRRRGRDQRPQFPPPDPRPLPSSLLPSPCFQGA